LDFEAAATASPEALVCLGDKETGARRDYRRGKPRRHERIGFYLFGAMGGHFAWARSYSAARGGRNRHRRRSLGVFERRQHIEPVLGPARQHNRLVDELEAVVPDDHQFAADSYKAADRKDRVRLLSVACHKEIVNLPDRFVRVIEDFAADDLGRTIPPSTV